MTSVSTESLGEGDLVKCTVVEKQTQAKCECFSYVFFSSCNMFSPLYKYEFAPALGVGGGSGGL